MALVVGEVVVRLVPTPEPEPYRSVEGGPLFVGHDEFGWATRPDAAFRLWSREYDIEARTDDIGLRELGPVGDSECRIVALGDSFVQGLTVSDDEHFASVAAAEIRARTGEECAVIPAGIEGFSTDQQLDVLSMLVSREGAVPRMVVLFPYFNDVYCNGRSDPWECWEGPDHRTGVERVEARAAVFADAESSNPMALDPAGSGEEEVGDADRADEVDDDERRGLPLSGLRRWLNDRSRLYALARTTALRWIWRGGSAVIEERRSVLLATPMPHRLAIYRVDTPPSAEEDWSRTVDLIRSIRDAVDEAGSRFAMIHVPMREAVRADEWTFGLEVQQEDERDWDPRAVEGRLEVVCGELEIACVLPLDHFRAAEGRGETGYLDLDPHWNASGHRWVGSWIADLTTGGSPPAPRP